MSVPTLSIVCMAVAMVFAFAAPVLLLLYYKKKGADLLPFFIGAAVFVIFALILESLVHNIVLKGLPVGEKILGNTLLYAFYGGLMAGLFEETGRFVAFKTVLKKKLGNDHNALMYGAGHGGVEAILMVGLAYISNIAMAVMIDLGMSDMLTAGLTGDTLAQVNAVLDTLTTTPASTYLLASVERCVAVTTHICLSVRVWFAARKPGKFWLYPLAILLHAALDGVLVILAAHLSVPAVEGCLVLTLIPIVLIACIVWKRNAQAEAVPAEETAAAE